MYVCVCVVTFKTKLIKTHTFTYGFLFAIDKLQCSSFSWSFCKSFWIAFVCVQCTQQTAHISHGNVHYSNKCLFHRLFVVVVVVLIVESSYRKKRIHFAHTIFETSASKIKTNLPEKKPRIRNVENSKKLLHNDLYSLFLFALNLVSVGFAVVVVVADADAVVILYFYLFISLFIFWSLHTGFQILLINRRIRVVCVCVCFIMYKTYIKEPRQSKLKWNKILQIEFLSRTNTTTTTATAEHSFYYQF